MELIKKKKKRKTGLNVKAKRKMAVARAVVKAGTGKITINKRTISMFEPRHLREFIEEPLQILPGIAKGADITVSVHGGGFMSQASAARSAIAKSLVLLSKECPRGERNFYVEKEKEFQCKSCCITSKWTKWKGSDSQLCPHCGQDAIPF